MNSNRKSSRYSIAPITLRPGVKSMPAPILLSPLKTGFSAGHGVHRSFSASGLLGRCVRLFRGFLQGTLRPAERRSTISAGHGVHRSNLRALVGARCARPPSSPTAPSLTGWNWNAPRARAARPYMTRSNGCAAAGHGVHRSFFDALSIGRSLRRRGLLLDAVAGIDAVDGAVGQQLVQGGVDAVDQGVIGLAHADGDRPVELGHRGEAHGALHGRAWMGEVVEADRGRRHGGDVDLTLAERLDHLVLEGIGDGGDIAPAEIDAGDRADHGADAKARLQIGIAG